MTTTCKVAAASVALVCLAALAPQPASAGGGGPPFSSVAHAIPSLSTASRTGVLRTVTLPSQGPHRAGAFTNPVVRNVLNPQPHSRPTGVLINPGVRHVLTPGVILGPPQHAGNGALLPPGPGAGGVPPGGGGSGPGPSGAPQDGPGVVGGGLASVIPSVGSDQPVGPASGPAAQPLIAGPSAAVSPVIPPNPCSCLTKATLADGSVLFRDLCTNQAAVAPPARTVAAPAAN